MEPTIHLNHRQLMEFYHEPHEAVARVGLTPSIMWSYDGAKEHDVPKIKTRRRLTWQA